MDPVDPLWAMYDAVYAAPRDLTRRRVLADALLEQGDVRGEFIAIQFETSAVAKKRARKLAQRHRAAFLGRLSEVVRRGSEVWEHGFLVGCSAFLDGTTVDVPAWATVRELNLEFDVRSLDGNGRLNPLELASPWMRSLQHLTLTVANPNVSPDIADLDRLRLLLDSAGRVRLLPGWIARHLANERARLARRRAAQQ